MPAIAEDYPYLITLEGQIGTHDDINIDRGWSDLYPDLGPPPDLVCAVVLISIVVKLTCASEKFVISSPDSDLSDNLVA